VRTSLRAGICLGVVVAGYFALGVVAGARTSPLTVPLPAGAKPPSWATGLANAAGLNGLGRDGLTGVAWAFLAVVLAAYALLLVEAWAGRVKLWAVLGASAASLAVSVASPLLLSRDVYTYAAYGRIEAVYHRNPYLHPLSAFGHDPFVAVASRQWLPAHTVYGPLFTIVSAGIARLWSSPASTILAYKLLAGLAVAAATVLVALAADRSRPQRAALAVALVGLNPVLVAHTVGGAHVDALIALPLAAALAIAVTRPAAASARALAVTLLLTAACLIKPPLLAALALWLWWTVRAGGRGRVLATHLAVISTVTLACLTPFAAGGHTLAPLATSGGLEAWASPSHLVGQAAQAIVASFAGSAAGADAAAAVEIAFLVVFVLLALHVGARNPPEQSLGIALLLLVLSLPYLLPWYAAWFAPFLGLLADEALLVAGTLVTGVLALTLVPADPFHGLTSPWVMDGVHYGAASVLLVVLLFVARRVTGLSRPLAAPLLESG
jgi:alpha-1,6-mannosyltransferase